MQSIPIPGAFWVALVVALVPALAAVLAQFFPESQYWWSPLIIAVLYAVLKAVQTAAAATATPTAPQPAAMARTGAPDGDDYTYASPKPRGFTSRWLLG
jgi:hypothetical protein